MSWPELMDAALQEYITERQSRALSTYEVDHNLLVEHVRQEDSFRTGGYGTRQIPELLQNAVDALGAGGGSGMIEFRLADGALYCANEGAAFDEAGITAVTYAFLSGKRGDEIGRFGLGFKSVLGVTDNPQIFSRSVSFAFNAPETAELFEGVPSVGGRYPLLRIPSSIDIKDARRTDRHLAEMMEWATTIVKLPLIREGARLRDELNAFRPESLLFMKPLERLRVAVQGKPEAPLETTEFTRVGRPSDGEVIIVEPDGTESRWLYAEREYQPSEKVAALLPSTMRRDSMTVSYAVKPEGRAGTGRLWAWFPLKDETTASGIFNAPWDVNDDRTSLVPGSLLNKAMLQVGAELFLDVVIRASTATDPAAHLDLFPARGREIRSNADKFLSNAIPHRARERAVIPDIAGELKVPGYFAGVPDLQLTPLTAAAAQIWQNRAPRMTMPHTKCFSSPARRARLRSLLGGAEDEKSTREGALSTWLEELIVDDEPASVIAALDVVRELQKGSPSAFEAALSGALIPLEGGGRARIDQSRTVLLPVDGMVVPRGVRVVRPDVAGSAAPVLEEFGFRSVSADEAAAALARTASARWADADWEHLWQTLRTVSPRVAAAELIAIRDRGIDVRMRAQDGQWRIATDLITDGSVARDIESRQVDSELAPNIELRRAAGTVSMPVRDYPVWRDGLRAEYVATMEDVVRRYLKQNGLTTGRFTMPDHPGVGPWIC